MLRRLVIAIAVAAAALAGVASTAPAVAAPAGAEECADTFYATAGREVFDLDPKYLPAPLRAFPPDCASRLTAEPFDDGTGISVAYDLFYVDIPFADVLDIVQALEAAGWTTGPGSGTIDAGDGTPTYNADFDAADFAALGPTLDFASARFVDPSGGPDSIGFTYTDGERYDNSTNVDVPSLVLSPLLAGPFGGTDVDDPSVLSGLHPFVTPTPVQTGVIAGGAVVLMLVVGWPSALLNSVVGSRYDGLVRWLTSRREKDAADPKPRRRLPGWLMWPGFALAAVLGAFVDPDFGWNPMSVRVVVTLFVSFVLFNLATWAIVRVIARRIQPDSRPLLRFRWGTLFLVALAVLVARLLQLEPGVIFGLVAGVAYATALRAMQSAVIALVGAGFGLVLALIAWTGYTLLAPTVAADPDSVPLIVLGEFLAGVTIKGVSSLPLALLPLGTLDGAKVMKWRKAVWAVAYAVGLAAFMLVLLSIPKAWGEIPGDFLRWLLIFGGYALLALVVWIVNVVLVKKRPPKETPVGEQPDAITID